MGHESKSSSSHHSSSKHKHRHREDKDEDRDRKRHRSSHHKSSSSKKRRDDESESDEWVEKESAPAPSAAPTAPPVDSYGTFSVGDKSAQGGLERLDDATDGYGDGETGQGKMTDGDLFSAMGTERKRREPKEKLDPTQTMGQSSRELNKAHWQGVPNSSGPTAPQITTPGSSGSAWRMSKLRRTFETADEEARSIEEVALERYGSLEAFEEAKEERRVLDERDGRRKSRTGGDRTPMGSAGGGASDSGGQSSRRFIFNDAPDPSSRPSSRNSNSFRRPGEAAERTFSNTSSALPSRPSTPIPSVFTPPPVRTPRVTAPSALSTSVVLDPDPTTTEGLEPRPVLSQSELNKLQAKVLKAKLMGDEKADEMERDYEREREWALTGGSMGTGVVARDEGKEVRMLPTIDGRGRLYDVGTGAEKEEVQQPGKRKKKEKFDSHSATGELIARSAADATTSLDELVRQERFGGGASDQKNMDMEMANQIAGDTRYKNDLDYKDENAEKLARKKMKSEQSKKMWAIQDYARTQKALANCTLCPTDAGDPPPAGIIAMGTRVYLALTGAEELVPGHCRIVPQQHLLSSLEEDEEGWEEVKNFMKTLMQMHAEEDKGVVFFESCINLKRQQHTFIEAIPVPFDLWDEIPAYFAEAIDSSEQEWSQHKKRIIFSSSRPFRRSLVANLPYFAVQWDYKGEKGYGHVIEGVDDAPDRDAEGEETRGEHGEKGGGEFPRWFAQEIIGGMLELEPRQWRKPRRVDFRENSKRVAKFRQKYDKYDWTKLLNQERS